MFDATTAYRSDDPIRYRRFDELGLTPFLERRQLLKIGALPLHCEYYPHHPQAPTLLFIPGIGTYSELYCELLARLADQGFNVLAVDLRGHGYSGGERGRYNVDEVVADLQQVLDLIEQHSDADIGLFGCSIGARLGLALAERDPRIRALLCHTLFLAELPPDLWHALGWSSLYFGNLFTPGLRINFRTFIDIDNLLQYNPMGQLADQDPLLVWEYPVSTLYSLYSYPSTILRQPLDVPSAIIIGSDDRVIPLDYCKRLVERSRQPFELIEIDAGSHMLPFDHIDDTLEFSSQWFNRALGRNP